MGMKLNARTQLAPFRIMDATTELWSHEAVDAGGEVGDVRVEERMGVVVTVRTGSSNECVVGISASISSHRDDIYHGDVVEPMSMRYSSWWCCLQPVAHLPHVPIKNDGEAVEVEFGGDFGDAPDYGVHSKPTLKAPCRYADGEVKE